MKMAIIFVAIVLAGCGHRVINCPDGEPVAVWSVEDAYQTYAREYEAKFSVAANQIDKIASDENVSIESKSKVVKLRQDLDQERSALQERLKTAVISLQTTPCDKEVRRRVLDLQQEFADRAKEIPERLKGHGIVHNQQMSNSPGSLQVGSVSSMTLNQFPSHSHAVDQLKSEITKLVRYPKAYSDISKPPSFIEKLLSNRLPGQMFELLMKYDEQDILNVPKVGGQLHEYKKRYYQFREVALDMENGLLLQIGEMVQVRFKSAWYIYLRYAVMRFAGQSKESIIAAGDFLNYDITWDETERVFMKLSSDPANPARISEWFSLHISLAQDANKIGSAI